MRRFTLAILLLFVAAACDSPDPLVRAGGADNGADPVESLPLERDPSDGPFLEVFVPACPGRSPAPIQPITTFEWRTLDGVDDPDQVRWILLSTQPFNDSYDETLDYIQDNPGAPEWSAWQTYDPANDIGTSWRTPPLDFGRYMFAVQGRNNGAPFIHSIELNRNAISLVVANRTTGPLLTLDSDFMDPVITASLQTPVTIINVQAGRLLEFCWSADASAYCGVIVAYRYGWDIIDPDNDDAWDVGWTDFDGSETCSPTRRFFFGTHTFTVEVIDNSGFRSRIPVRLNISQPEPAAVDIRPGACPNPLNPKSKGVVWAVLIGSPSLDVSQVDPTSLVLNTLDGPGLGAPALQTKLRDGTAANESGDDCACPLNGHDGFMDLHAKFSTRDLAEAIGPTPQDEDVQLALTGVTYDGTAFMAIDCVRLVGVKIPDEPPPPPGPDTEIFRVTNGYRLNGQWVVDVIDTEDAVPDTVPEGSWTTVFYRGSPQIPGSGLCVDPNNECLSFQKQLAWSHTEVPFSGTTSWMPSPPEDNDPFSTYDSTSVNMGTVDYTLRFRSVDETSTADTSPPEVDLVANFEPTLTDYSIVNYDGTVVQDGERIVWNWWLPANFNGSIADTLDLSDPPNLWVVREFFFVIKASGRDHPKEDDNGGVKSWLYLFRETANPQVIRPFARAGVWNEADVVNSLCDTFEVSVRYSLADDPGGVQARQELANLVDMSYDYSVIGRDSGLADTFRQYVFVYGSKTLINEYASGSLGRTTMEGMMTFRLDLEFGTVAMRTSGLGR